jgi:hypothetical protein
VRGAGDGVRWRTRRAVRMGRAGAAAMGGGPEPVCGGGGVAGMTGGGEQQRAAFAHRCPSPQAPTMVSQPASIRALGPMVHGANQRRNGAGFAVGAVVVSVRGCCDGLCMSAAMSRLVLTIGLLRASSSASSGWWRWDVACLDRWAMHCRTS